MFKKFLGISRLYWFTAVDFLFFGTRGFLLHGNTFIYMCKCCLHSAD